MIREIHQSSIARIKFVITTSASARGKTLKCYGINTRRFTGENTIFIRVA